MSKLKVFISSAQKELQNHRVVLEKIINNKPYLSCRLLENSGASTTDVVNASLIEVRESDIYIGIFGKFFSDTTAKEYREAVKKTMPIFVYAKKIKDTNRESELSTFLVDEIKGSFKIHFFKNKQDLFNMVEENLGTYLFNLLRIGLQEHARNNKYYSNITKSLVDESNTIDSVIDINNKYLEESKKSYHERDFESSFMKSFIALESWLRKTLQTLYESRKTDERSIRKIHRASMRELIEIAKNNDILNSHEVSGIKDLIPSRNNLIHNGTPPDDRITKFAVEHVSKIIERHR